MRRVATLTAATLGLLIAADGAVRADEPAAQPPSPTAEEESTEGGDAIGLTIDVGYATAYVFRGYNVFQKESQLDPHMLIAPGIAWSAWDTGLSVGYLGLFQISGDNVGAVLDAGLGGEQDLFVTYTREITDGLSLGGSLTAYLYPLADEQTTGSGCPVYLEPAINATFATVVDLSLTVAWFLGIQDEPAIRGISYVYFNPAVGKRFELGDVVGLGLRLGYGFKVFHEGNDGVSNVHDVSLAVSLPITLGAGFTLTPALTGAWTNIEDTVDGAGHTQEKTFTDGLAVAGSLNVGVSL